MDTAAGPGTGTGGGSDRALSADPGGDAITQAFTQGRERLVGMAWYVLSHREDALEAVQELDGPRPAWVQLVVAQQAIDRGDMREAAEAAALFRSAWDGHPPQLLAYVEDIERYVQTH